MSLAITAAFGIGAITGPVTNDPFIEHIHARVMETIEKSENVPGLKSDVFNAIRPGVKECWSNLVKKGSLLVSDAADSEVRPFYVTLQGIIEHVIAKELHKSIKSSTGAIHTPTPPTPLCLAPDQESVPNLAATQSILEDPQSLFTVKARKTIVREYLAKGGDLYAVYPKGGEAKRSNDEMKEYNLALENNSSHLFKWPIDAAIENDLIGAFYVFRSNEGKQYAFAIQMTQANAQKPTGDFGLWFGEYTKDSPVYNRISRVMEVIGTIPLF